ncbi:MAG TPA: asparagine synthase, partial [Burkholderiales bacterium]|nr:asparagine synthase [Burkholderiales bacterium]
MSGLCGWFDTERGSASPQAIAAMAAPLNRFDASAVRSASAAFGAVAAAGSDADVFQDGDTVAAVWGRARFSDPDLAALAERHGAAHALARGYEREGSGVLAGVSGACAVAVLKGRGEAMLAIDRMG